MTYPGGSFPGSGVIDGPRKLPVMMTVADADGTVLQANNFGLKAGGVEIRLTTLQGWWETADVRANPVDVPGGDGAYDDDPLFSGRTITASGVVLADNATALMSMEPVFRQLLAKEARRGTVTIGVSDNQAERCSVRLGGKTVFSPTHPWRAEWSISLFAARPERLAANAKTASTQPYAPSAGLSFPWTFPLDFGGIGTTGRISAANGGSIKSGVKLDISGACLNPQIVLIETGERIAFQTELSVGGALSIDTNTANRSVLRDGTAPWGFTMTSDSSLFLLRPGTNTLLFLTDSGTPTLTATWSDANP